MKKLIVTSLFLLFACGAHGQDSLNVRRVAQLSYPEYGECDIERVVVQDTIAYLAAGSGFVSLVNIADPAHPVETGRYRPPGTAHDISVQGHYAFVADITVGLRIVNVADPSNPIEVGHLDMPVWDVASAGNFVYVTNGELRIVDVSNPTAPVIRGIYTAPFDALEVAVSGNYAYVADGYGGLRVVDITAPDLPQEVGHYNASGGVIVDVAVAGDKAYLADWSHGLRVIDIADPLHPVEIGNFQTPSNAMEVAVAGDFAFVADHSAGLRVINTANSPALFEVGFHHTLWATYGVAVSGNHALVADQWYCEIFDCSEALEAPGHAALPPHQFVLNAAYPNPFNATATIEFSLPRQMPVTLDVYDILGERVATLVNGSLSAGAHQVAFDGSRLASGVYVYRLNAGEFSDSRKMVMMK